MLSRWKKAATVSALTLVVLLTVSPSTANPATAQSSSVPTPVVTAEFHAPNLAILTWPLIEGVSRYEVWQWKEERGWEYLGSVNWDQPGVVSSTITLFESGTFFFTVQAVNPEGERSDWAEYVSVALDVVPTPTPTPTPAFDEPCPIVQKLNDSGISLHVETRNAYIERFGQEPGPLTVERVVFHPRSDFIQVDYSMLRSDGSEKAIYESWNGCTLLGYSIGS